MFLNQNIMFTHKSQGFEYNNISVNIIVIIFFLKYFFIQTRPFLDEHQERNIFIRIETYVSMCICAPRKKKKNKQKQNES